MIEYTVNPKVRNIGDVIIVDVCPGIALRLSVEDSLKFLTDLNRATQRAMSCCQHLAFEIDVEFDDECTTQRRVK